MTLSLWPARDIDRDISARNCVSIWRHIRPFREIFYTSARIFGETIVDPILSKNVRIKMRKIRREKKNLHWGLQRGLLRSGSHWFRHDYDAHGRNIDDVRVENTDRANEWPFNGEYFCFLIRITDNCFLEDT